MPAARSRKKGPKRSLRCRRPENRFRRLVAELLEPRLVLSHCGPFDLGDGLGPKFIGDGITTFIEDFEDNPNHEDPATVPAGVDACEAQGERLFTHVPSQPTLLLRRMLDAGGPGNEYVLVVGRGETREIQFRGIHPDYEVAAVGLDVASDGFGPIRIEFIGQGGTIVMEGTGGHISGQHLATRGSLIPGTQTELGSIQSVRFTSLGSFHTGFDNVTLLIAPQPVNDPPIPFDDRAFVLPSLPNDPTSVRIDVLANDDDPEGHALSLVSVTAPLHGTAVIDGFSVVYTPPTNFLGIDEFQYTVRDEEGMTATANVEVVVNTPPTATGTDYFFAHGTTGPIVIGNPGLLEHAFDADGDALSAFLVDPPEHGNVSVQPGGGFTYTPTTPDGRVVGDVFSYRVSDGQQTSNVAQVGINVPNQPPVAEDVVIEFAHGLPDGLGGNFRVSDADSDPISVEIVDGPDHGTVTLNADGTFFYEPDPRRDYIDFHTGIFHSAQRLMLGSDSFTYRASDGADFSPPATVTLLDFNNERPESANDNFVVSSGTDELAPTQLSGPLTFATATLHLALADEIGQGVLYELRVANISNVVRVVLRVDDAVVAELYSAPPGGGPRNGVLVSDRIGSARLVGPGDIFTFVENLAAGRVFVEIETNDGQPPLDSGPGDFSDDGPLDFRRYEIAAQIQPGEFEAMSAAPGVLWNDTDLNGDVLSAILVDPPRYGRVELGADGSFSYFALPGLRGDDSFTYQATDGFRTSDPSRVTLQVEPNGPQVRDDVVTLDLTDFTSHILPRGEGNPFEISIDELRQNDHRMANLQRFRDDLDSPVRPDHLDFSIPDVDPLAWPICFAGTRHFSYRMRTTDVNSPEQLTTYALVTLRVNDTDINHDGIPDSEEGYCASEEAFQLSGIDFGDAPDSYGTLLASNGARHIAPGPLMDWFSLPEPDDRDGELDGQPTPRADGDGQTRSNGRLLTDIRDEDNAGLRFQEGDRAITSLIVDNPTSEPALLAGWIDFDGDGRFEDATEKASAAVPAEADDLEISLTFPYVFAAGDAGFTYARFRVSTDPAAENPTGAAADGEVEDHLVSVVARRATVIADEQKISDMEGNFTGALPDFAQFGSSLAHLGDLDGDGLADLAVAAVSGEEPPFASSILILFLQDDGTVKIHQQISQNVGGFPFPIPRFAALAALGDVDGDGVVDLAVGDASDDDGGQNNGAVWILFLNTNGTVKGFQKISATSGGFADPLEDSGGFGRAVAAVGDVDGDGVVDLAAGAPDDDGQNPDQGAVWIVLLNADGTVKQQQQITTGAGGFTPELLAEEAFGVSLAGLGDLDGDGISDLAVGALGDGTQNSFGEPLLPGALWVLFLNGDGTVKDFQKIAELEGQFTGQLQIHSFFGRAVANIGDYDGDGVTDLVVSSLGDLVFDDRQMVWLLLMNVDGTVKRHQQIAWGLSGFDASLDPADDFGASLAPLGDLDGDGQPDIAVGAPGILGLSGHQLGAVWILFTTGQDLDADEIPDAIEDAAPGGGDGNGDGLLDSRQFNVASMASPAGYVTLVAPPGTTLFDVGIIDNPSPADAPSDYQFPLGFLEFWLGRIETGSAVAVELILHAEPPLDAYFKYGRTWDNPDPHWYEFLFDGTTGAELIDSDGDGGVERIILHFVDGQRGDNLSVDGLIQDPGGPAAAAPILTSFSITGPMLAVRGQPLEFSFTAEPAGEYRYEIDWDGDGAIDETHQTAQPLVLAHAFHQSGDYQVAATVSTLDGTASVSATHDVSIEAVALVNGELLAGGTSAGDNIHFRLTKKRKQSLLLVRIGNSQYGPFSYNAVARLAAYGQEGDDRIIVPVNIKKPARLDGGEGNDLLNGGPRDNFLVGGEGNDTLHGGRTTNLAIGGDGNDILKGGRKRDVLIGGLGRDLLFGGGGDDLLIGGATSHDQNDAALLAILAEWTARRGLAARIANLAGRDAGSERANGDYFLRQGETVFDDGDQDMLFGQGGNDWLLAFGDFAPTAGRRDRIHR